MEQRNPHFSSTVVAIGGGSISHSSQRFSMVVQGGKAGSTALSVSGTIAFPFFLILVLKGMDPCPICRHYFPLCDPVNQAGDDEFDFAMSILKKDDTESIFVPCSSRARLHNIFPGKIMVAKGTGVPHDYGIPINIPYASTHYIWMEDWGTKTYLHGPGWKALMDAYYLTLNDIVLFRYDPENNIFNVEVISGDGDIKPWRRLPAFWIVKDCCLPALEKAFFIDVEELTQHEMSAVCYAMYQQGLFDDPDAEVPQFYVHKLHHDDMWFLVYGEMWDEMPTSMTCFYATSQDWRKEHVIKGTYKKTLENDWLSYREGWGEICTPAQLYKNSIMMAKLCVHDNCITLEVTKVVSYY